MGAGRPGDIAFAPLQPQQEEGGGEEQPDGRIEQGYEKLSRQSASCVARRHHKRRWITVGLRQTLYRRHYGPSGTAAGDEADRNAGAAATIARSPEPEERSVGN